MIIMFDGRVLENPSNTQIVEAIGIRTSPGAGLYDVAVIGAAISVRQPRPYRKKPATPR